MNYPQKVVFKLKSSDVHNSCELSGWEPDKEYPQKLIEGMDVKGIWDGGNWIINIFEIDNEDHVTTLLDWINRKIRMNHTFEMDGDINPDWDYEIEADDHFMKLWNLINA